MNPTLASMLIRLYPRAWRERYGVEFQAFLEAQPGNLSSVANTLQSALKERIFPTRGGSMDPQNRSFTAMLKHPSAFLPMAMSLIALTMLLIDLSYYGIAHEVAQKDEGAVAHLWQLLMAGQVPIIAFFAIRWLPRAPRQSLPVLALQAGAALASATPVLLLGL
jgi:hypothetical protein